MNLVETARVLSIASVSVSGALFLAALNLTLTSRLAEQEAYWHSIASSVWPLAAASLLGIMAFISSCLATVEANKALLNGQQAQAGEITEQGGVPNSLTVCMVLLVLFCVPLTWGFLTLTDAVVAERPSMVEQL